MPTTLFVFVLALAFALAGTPSIRRIAIRLGFLDRPSARKMQQKPIPLLGGVAIYLGVFIAIVAVQVIVHGHFLPELTTIIAGATLVSLLGLWDDRISLPAWVKLAGQLVAAGGMVISGVYVQLSWLPDWLNIAITLLWITGITNALNLLDNMDGLAGGITAVAASFFTIVAAMNGQILVSAMSAALFGACLGFLVFNSKPASIFMGDAGSLFLGFILAVIGIKLRFPENTNVVTWMVPVLILGVPIFDTTLVFVSRIRKGKNPLTAAGKDHTSHRLVMRGFTEREAVYAIYLAGAAFGLLAMFIMQASAIEGYLVASMALITSVWALVRLERRLDRFEKSQRESSP